MIIILLLFIDEHDHSPMPGAKARTLPQSRSRPQEVMAQVGSWQETSNGGGWGPWESDGKFTNEIRVCLKIVYPIFPMVNDHYPY